MNTQNAIMVDRPPQIANPPSPLAGEGSDNFPSPLAGEGLGVRGKSREKISPSPSFHHHRRPRLPWWWSARW